MLTHLFIRPVIGAFLIFIIGAVHADGATFTVTNADDSGPGSLRDALTQANANGQEDTIDFDAGFFSSPRTITLTSGELAIAKDDVASNNPGRLLTINGPGADLLTISGNNNSRVFYVATRANVALRGMTVRDGVGVGAESLANGNGAGIYATVAYVTLSDMTVRNNSANGEGGGVYLNSIASFTMSDSLVTENFAVVYGGGIRSSPMIGGVTIRNTVISNNSTNNRAGGVALHGGVTTIENCLITGNRAGLAVGGTNAVGGLDFFQTAATVTDTTISNNRSGTSSEIGGTVGGVRVNGGGNVVFRRVTVSGNTAYTQGGGMDLRGGGSANAITIVDSTISGNQIFGTVSTPTTQGGGIRTENASGQISIINTTIAGNLADNGIGGGIANFTDDLFVINSTITNNTASGPGPGIPGGGGGINNANDFGAVTHIQNSIVAKNSGAGVGNNDVVGTFMSDGYNLIGDTTGSAGFGATGDQSNVDPLLDPNGLQNNGGRTLTIALQPNSPAIDKGKTVADVTTDQRGVTRPTDNSSIPNAAGGDGSDIGAFEIGAPNGVAERTLGNIATRLPVLTGENVLIGGIIVVGDVAKRVIIRALGPSLGAKGVAGALEDPTLELYQGDELLAANDNWRDGQDAEIRDTGVQPIDDREAAIVRTLEPGSYTAVVSGKGETTGVALVEGYDLDQRPNSKLANISTRGSVGSGEDVLIGGFIVGPTTKVVVRAIGPSLGNAGVGGALQDPRLDLVNANGEVIRSNDNWKSSQRAELEAIGIQPSDDRESALISTLTAGNYTAVVRGVAGTGVGLVEVYNLQ